MSASKVSWRHKPTARRWLESLRKKVEAVRDLKGENAFLSRNPDPIIPERPFGDNEGIWCMILFTSLY
jgi:hypothetical protein